MPPAVSVLLPVRDGADTLDEALASLADQTEPDFEVVAVDDGSADGTAELLRRWARRDARVRVLSQPRAGIVAALEAARASARGRFLARMDADDRAEPNRLERQRALMEARPSLAACGCGVRYFPRRRLTDGARRYEAWINSNATSAEVHRDLFVECPLAHPTFFLRAEAVEAAGGYRDVGWPEDYDLLLRVWAAGGELANVPEVLLHWRDSAWRLSRTHERYSPEAFLACKVHHLRQTLLRRRGGVVIWGAGPVGKTMARALQRAGERVRAFAEVDRRKVGQEIHGAPVLDTPSALAVEGALHLAAVGQPGARQTLRELLTGAGLKELEDFVAVA